MTDRQLDEIVRGQALPAPSPQTVRQIQAAVLKDLRPVRPLASGKAYAASLGIVLLGICALSCYLMPNLAGWQELGAVRRGVVFSPLALIAALLVVSTVQQLSPAGKYKQQVLQASAGAVVLLLAAIVILFRPAQEPAFVSGAWACFRVGMLFSVPAAAAFLWLLRGGARLSPGLAGGTAGALAGFGGMSVLEIHCPNFDLDHILVAHVSVALLCALGGLLVSSLASRLRDGRGDLLQTTNIE